MRYLYQHTPAAVARRAGLHRFRQVVRYAGRRSPFYRRAFADRGIDARRVRTPADLGDFFTTPEDLIADPESFLCRRPNLVFESSGTSGKNKRVFYSRREMGVAGKSFATGFGLMGITPDDRVANAFDFNIWNPGHVCHAGLMAAGNFCQAFGKVDPAEVYRRLKQGRFTVVLGEPTWLIRLTQLAEADGGGKLQLPDRRGRGDAGRRRPVDAEGVGRGDGEDVLLDGRDGRDDRLPAVRRPRRLPPGHDRLPARDGRRRRPTGTASWSSPRCTAGRCR